MMLGSEGLNLNEKISSGASSSAWQLNKIRNKSVWVPRLGSYGLLKPVSESTLHCFKEEHAKCLIQPWLWLMLINSGAELGRFKGQGAKWKKCNIIACRLGLRMLEIPFPTASIFKIIWERMPSNPLQGTTEPPFLQSCIPISLLVRTEPLQEFKDD